MFLYQVKKPRNEIAIFLESPVRTSWQARNRMRRLHFLEAQHMVTIRCTREFLFSRRKATECKQCTRKKTVHCADSQRKNEMQVVDGGFC